jgi:carboxymethylenebutenolidase
VDRRKLGVIGFCVGGRFAFLANARLPNRFKAAVSIYGGSIAPAGSDPFGRTPPIVHAQQLQAPQLLIYANRDPSIPIDEHTRIAQRLATLGKRYVLSVYPDVTHGFCCEERASFHPESARAAIAETADFLHRQLVAG